MRVSTNFLVLVAAACPLLTAQTGPDAIAALKASGGYEGLKQTWRRTQYAVDKERGAYVARNAAQKLELSFHAAGTTLRVADGSVTLQLLGYGYEGDLRTPEPAQLTGSGNRMEYRRGALAEWYVNDERGLEQGFSLATRPAGAAESGPLEIALTVTGALRPHANSSTQVSLLDSHGRAVLRYGDLRAWDSERRPLDSRLEVHDRQVRLIVEDSRAVYPITIDPLVSAIILLASDAASADGLGTSIAVDGTTAVIGAPGKGGAKGAAEVFTRSGSTWSQQAELLASDGVRLDQFGASVSVSGNTILVGAAGQASGQGVAYVFVQSGTTWSQQAELTASDGAAADAFGSSVSLSGSTAIVGAPGKASGHGAVYVFTASNGTWSQQTEFAPTDSASGDLFGNSVALNGSTVVAGAYAKNKFQGAAYVFVKSAAGTWSQQAKLAATPLASDAELGFSVAVSGDTAILGTRSKSFAPGVAYIFVRNNGATWTQQAMFGSPSDSGANGFASAVAINGDTVLCAEPGNLQLFGEAYVFVRSGSTWTPQPKLTASDGTIGAVFASSVALSADAAVFGSPSKGNGQGGGYAFVRSGATFVQQAVLTAAGGSNSDAFGSATSVSGDTVMVGAPSKASATGAVYVFVRSGAAWSQENKLTASDGVRGDNFGTSISVNGDTALIGATGKAGKGAVYVFARTGSTWIQQSLLTASDATNGDAFGISVSLDHDTAVVGATGRLAATGVAYVFVRSGPTWTQQAKLTASDAAVNDIYGSSVSVSGDTAVVGARFKPGGGAAYVYVRSGSAWTQQAKLTPDPIGSNFGYTVSLDHDTALVGSYLDGTAPFTGNGVPVAGPGAAYVFVRSGATWTRQSKLAGSDTAAGSTFGNSVSLSGDTAVVGASNALSRQGEAYIFMRVGSIWNQQFVLTAPDAASGDGFGYTVSVSAGTVVAGSPSKAAGEGEAYVFPLPIITPGSIVDAISSLATFAPGSLAMVSGTNFSNVDTPNGDPPWQTSLNGVSLTVNGTLAALGFAGYQSITFQMPYETATGPATIVVNVNGVSSNAVQVTVSDTSPGVVATPDGRAVVQNADSSMNSADNPADDESLVMIFCAGLGLLDNPIPDGEAAPGDPMSNALTVPTVTIGGSDAPVTSATMLPGMVGIGLIAAQVPDLAAGDYPVVITQGAQSSNGPMMSVSGNVVASSKPTKGGVRPAAPLQRHTIPTPAGH